ncbi:RimK/LysX family protein [Ferrimonas sp. YFM]|uniref:ATP-dependent zinc protease family protein n=1 Tax=Ferrimonas sp. YFM TaxID=3028878 RepID=UPI0025735A0B|nr:RimK/LysX family protein [Ferrimonas sp. YFM]BDY05179.1 ribosomal protein S6 modification protein [Ferrimonas sp. YFM]
MDSEKRSAKRCAGWREWAALPDLGIGKIKAKMDTGARTSCLHAFHTRVFDKEGQPWLEFHVHPIQRDVDTVVICQAPIVDQRDVTDSGGHVENRPVILTLLTLGSESWPIEMTVTNRDTMKFRMLIGRTAMSGRLLIDSDSSYLLGEQPK